MIPLFPRKKYLQMHTISQVRKYLRNMQMPKILYVQLPKVHANIRKLLQIQNRRANTQNYMRILMTRCDYSVVVTDRLHIPLRLTGVKVLPMTMRSLFAATAVLRSGHHQRSGACFVHSSPNTSHSAVLSLPMCPCRCQNFSCYDIFWCGRFSFRRASAIYIYVPTYIYIDFFSSGTLYSEHCRCSRTAEHQTDKNLTSQRRGGKTRLLMCFHEQWTRVPNRALAGTFRPFLLLLLILVAECFPLLPRKYWAGCSQRRYIAHSSGCVTIGTIPVASHTSRHGTSVDEST